MNKGELVDKVAEKASASLDKTVTKKEVDSVISATIDAIVEAVAKGEKVTLVGFGSFERRERKEREGRNPKTGDTMVIPATSVPAFSAGKLFKDKVAKDK
ncbi:MAG: HU family DNA-binding protein [Cyanobacteria bacterium REEB459]|nr:HU family DNA-binding protein [Cyanobacteria bacterium REEB459]